MMEPGESACRCNGNERPHLFATTPGEPCYKPADPQSLDDMRSYLGKRVLVTLDYDTPKATVVGVLHRLTDDGEVHVREDGGAMAYCWPCLRVEPWPND